MRHSGPRFLALLSSLLITAAVSAQSGERLSTALSEARITINNRADANGYVVLRVTPVGGEARVATVDILDRMSENDIAADIEKELTIALRDTYTVQRTGGENVRIRKADRDNTPDFVLEIAFNTPGLAITIDD